MIKAFVVRISAVDEKDQGKAARAFRVPASMMSNTSSLGTISAKVIEVMREVERMAREEN